MSRDDTTRYLAHCILAQEKVVTCCVALVRQHGATRSSRRAQQAWLARHVFRGVATAWIRVDMSTSLFPEVVLRLMPIQSTKDRTCTCERHCLFVVRHVVTSTARHARQVRHERHVVLVVTWRSKWNLAILGRLSKTCFFVGNVFYRIPQMIAPECWQKL